MVPFEAYSYLLISSRTSLMNYSLTTNFMHFWQLLTASVTLLELSPAIFTISLCYVAFFFLE